jgi:hypothetical protein
LFGEPGGVRPRIACKLRRDIEESGGLRRPASLCNAQCDLLCLSVFSKSQNFSA